MEELNRINSPVSQPTTQLREAEEAADTGALAVEATVVAETGVPTIAVKPPQSNKLAKLLKECDPEMDLAFVPAYQQVSIHLIDALDSANQKVRKQEKGSIRLTIMQAIKTLQDYFFITSNQMTVDTDYFEKADGIVRSLENLPGRGGTYKNTLREIRSRIEQFRDITLEQGGEVFAQMLGDKTLVENHLAFVDKWLNLTEARINSARSEIDKSDPKGKAIFKLHKQLMSPYVTTLRNAVASLHRGDAVALKNQLDELHDLKARQTLLESADRNGKQCKYLMEAVNLYRRHLGPMRDTLMLCIGAQYSNTATQDIGRLLTSLNRETMPVIKIINNETSDAAKGKGSKISILEQSSIDIIKTKSLKYLETTGKLLRLYTDYLEGVAAKDQPRAALGKARLFSSLVQQRRLLGRLCTVFSRVHDLMHRGAELKPDHELTSTDEEFKEGMATLAQHENCLVPVLNGVVETFFQELPASIAPPVSKPARKPPSASRTANRTRQNARRNRSRKGTRGRKRGRRTKDVSKKTAAPPPASPAASNLPLEEIKPAPKLAELLPERTSSTPAKAIVPQEKTTDFLDSVTPKDWKKRAYPEQYRLHSERLQQLHAWLTESNALQLTASTDKQRKFLLFQEVARCQELIESTLVRTLARCSLTCDGVHVLDLTPEGTDQLLRNQHSLCLHAAVLGDHPAYKSIISEHRTLLEELDAAHSLVFYLEGSGRVYSKPGSRALKGRLRALSRANSQEIAACEAEIKAYVEETLLFVGKLLSASTDKSEATVSKEVAALLNATSPLQENTTPSTTSLATIEAEEIEEPQFSSTTNRVQALSRLKSCKNLVASIRFRPVVPGMQARERRRHRNVGMAHVGRYIEWLEAILGADTSVEDYPLSLALPSLDALHRAFKQSVVAALYQQPVYVSNRHRVSCPTSNGHPRLLRMDNDVCATYRVLAASSPEGKLSTSPENFEKNLVWLSNIHDRLGYPDRKRGEEQGIYGLVSRLDRRGRELRIADKGEWSKMKGGKALNLETIQTGLKADTKELMETAVYPGLDALYQILSEAF